jgi:hypothetical protein
VIFQNTPFRTFDSVADHWQNLFAQGEPMKTVKLTSMDGSGKAATLAALEAERDRLLQQIAERNETIEKLKAPRRSHKPKPRKLEVHGLAAAG